ncbi:hypothetical protein ACDX78_03455 [Virgibacillus oceani]
MGLYINHNNNEGIFGNKEDLSAPNQGFFMRNHVEEMIQAQQRVNVSMEKAIGNLSVYQKQQDGKQQAHWLEMQHYLQELVKVNRRQEQVEGRVMKQLQNLEEKNEKLTMAVNESGAYEKEKVDQMYASQQALLSQLKGYESEVKKLIGKIDEQAAMHQQLAEKVNGQERSQEEVLGRLENQEALTAKMLRQFDHFRSALFERTTFLAEKIEDSAEITSAYMTKLMSRKEQPTTLYK